MSTEGSWGMYPHVNFKEKQYSKVNSEENGSKNDPMAPRTTLEYPHEGPCVVTENLVLSTQVFSQLP